MDKNYDIIQYIKDTFDEALDKALKSNDLNQEHDCKMDTKGYCECMEGKGEGEIKKRTITS